MIIKGGDTVTTYITESGLLVRGEPLEPLTVIWQVWNCPAPGGSVIKALEAGKSNDLRAAVKAAVTAGRELRRPNQPSDFNRAHYWYPQIIVDVVATAAELAEEAAPPEGVSDDG